MIFIKIKVEIKLEKQYYIHILMLICGIFDINGEVPERSKGTDCKSVGSAFEGSNPSLTTNLRFRVKL